MTKNLNIWRFSWNHFLACETGATPDDRSLHTGLDPDNIKVVESFNGSNNAQLVLFVKKWTLSRCIKMEQSMSITLH